MHLPHFCSKIKPTFLCLSTNISNDTSKKVWSILPYLERQVLGYFLSNVLECSIQVIHLWMFFFLTETYCHFDIFQMYHASDGQLKAIFLSSSPLPSTVVLSKQVPFVTSQMWGTAEKRALKHSETALGTASAGSRRAPLPLPTAFWAWGPEHLPLELLGVRPGVGAVFQQATLCYGLYVTPQASYRVASTPLLLTSSAKRRGARGCTPATVFICCSEQLAELHLFYTETWSCLTASSLACWVCSFVTCGASCHPGSPCGGHPASLRLLQAASAFTVPHVFH